MKDITKIAKFLEESGLLIKGVSEAIENVWKQQRGGVLALILGTLASMLLLNVLAGKGVIQAAEGTIRTGQDF